MPVPLPREYADRTLNVERWTVKEKGGHFAAFEEPELYANDVTEFAHEVRTRTGQGQAKEHGRVQAGTQTAFGNTRG
jgi:hypothetical protein